MGAEGAKRLRLRVRGAVQGVGFRPFVYRLARELDLKGFVRNSPQGVTIEVEGPPSKLEEFRARLEAERPPRAVVQRVECEEREPRGEAAFVIETSDAAGAKTALVLPDIATCPECLQEIFDPRDRRHRYPFTNCTNCGPRFTIIERLPYDRPNTTMRAFAMCPRCREEYENPLDRRFHAQPNACPECGPHLELWAPDGTLIATHDDALKRTAEAIRGGRIVALKGLGGFHLIVDARDGRAVTELRRRKRRGEKPFALMYPSLDLLRAHCRVAPEEERLLTSPEAPIVLLRRSPRGEHEVAEAVAPENPYLGAMLPYTPLHHLLLKELGFPVVATSGNLSEEPICTDEREALTRLKGIADLFLVHNRPIARPCDDSVVRVIDGRAVVLRRARGYAPLPVSLPESWPVPARPSSGSGSSSSSEARLAVGGHLKNAVALAIGREVFLSQHVGDLDAPETRRAFLRAIRDLAKLYERELAVVVCDAHPDYASTQHARTLGKPLVRVQHHVAHIWSGVAEHDVKLPALGVAWDGTGYGLDGTVWGGEFFILNEKGRAERVAHLRRFRLPGGERAVKEPRRAALGLLYELLGERAFEQEQNVPTLRAFAPRELSALRRMLERGVNAPWTSSAGRLFDAVASLLGVRQRVSFEGQAAMALEFWAEGTADAAGAYPFAIIESKGVSVVDWGPLVRAILNDQQQSVPVERIARGFHEALAAAIVEVARRVGLERVVLSGGCFQNKLLVELALQKLRAEGFVPFAHERVPPNDGGLALGQIAAAVWEGGPNVSCRARPDRRDSG